jgi:hypothetical protein
VKRWFLLLAVVTACSDEQNVGFINTPAGIATGSTRPWVIALGSPGMDWGAGAAIDSRGDVIAVGSVASAADFGSGEIAGTNFGFITKRAAFDGSERWTVVLKGGQTSVVDSVGVDGDDSVLVGGDFEGTVDFGGASLTAPQGGAFLAKYSSAGVLEWVRPVGATLAVAPDGHVFVSDDVSIAEYDSSGTPVWRTAFDPNVSIIKLAVAGNGDLVVLGELAGAASVGGAVLDPDGNECAFVARYHSDGTYVSSATIANDVLLSAAIALAVDGSGNPVVETDERHGSGDTVQVHALDANDSDVWEMAVPDDTPETPVKQVLLAGNDGTITSTMWFSQLEIVTYASGTATITSLGNATGGAELRGGGTTAFGVAAFAGDFGSGTLTLGDTTATAHGGDVVVVHVPLPSLDSHGDVVSNQEAL